MKALFAILIFLFVTNGYSQEQSKFDQYDQLAWCAMIHYKDKEYKSALDKFELAFQILPGESVDDYFYAAASALHLNENKKAEELIIEAIIQTNAYKGYFDSFEEFNPYRNLRFFKKLDRQYEKYTSLFFKNLDHPEIYREILQMLDKDQEVRKNGGDLEAVDLVNSTRLIEINKQYGWQDRAWLILWHQRIGFESEDYFWSYFRPYINEQISAGTIRKDFWARFEDNKSIENGKQIYGLYWGQFDDFPVEDVKNIDSIRSLVGLPPLWYMEKVYGIKPPANYQVTQESRSFVNCNSAE